MELIIGRSALLGGLNLAQGIVERRNTVPILGNVLIEAGDSSLTLAATDMEVGMRTRIACECARPGAITLSAHKLFEIVRETEAEEVSLRSAENDWVEIKCGRARFKMMSLDPRSFPAMPSAAEKTEPAAGNAARTELNIGARVLTTMIDKTIFAVSPDETRYNLSGVYIECPAPDTVRMAATDGHRLSLIDRPAPGFSMSAGAILPRKGLNELRRLLDSGVEGDVLLSVEAQLAWLLQGSTEISMRRVEGEFPDYRGVIPKDSRYQVGIGRDSLLAAIKRAAIFSSERYHGIRLGLSSGSLTVSSTSPELGEASETVDVEFTGEEFSVGFNAAYLIQAVTAIPAQEQVLLGVTDEVSPGVLTTPADSSYLYVVMPMRL
ncbi:MAG TPA: DNA polymerase III subunit beta [Candidatus Binataceae bacterium]